ncbi:SMI1/KNR4 family protein [Kroppenstedtia pulmonis]|uniref:SMI1/KNR4 family protein n=1 Tax=Kroppenstedtia pulmonis TaxID=1380685 RepID=A0A7D3XIF0_9BACL|nr:SMI1/KNR4 family protein [Kroppenstedtia pulmonis]QKG84464.1 SMI1/KNR4 family protein [Kroppenstedtia pulmonis]
MEWLKLDEPLSEREITQVEDQLGLKLPEDYVKWIRQYEGPESDFVSVDVNGEPHDVEGFYGPESLVDEMNLIFESREEYKGHGIIIPFAIDSILSKYCFFYPKGSQEPSGVFFRSRDVDLSDIFEGNDIKKSLYISQTFQGFLDKLYIDEDWI